jgi:hypothetical protein
METGRGRVAFAVLAAFGLAACASVLGIQDRSLDTQGQDDEAGAGTDGPEVEAGVGPPVQMVTGLNHPFLMTADETNVYWTEFGDSDQAGNGSVKSCAATGCDSGPLIYAVLQSGPRGIAVDAQNVYWGTDGAISSCPIAGCPGGKVTQVVAAGVPYQLAVDAMYVYWADNYDDTVHRARKVGGGDDVLWNASSGTVGLTNGQGCAVDATNVYVTDSSIGLYRLPITGGNLVAMYTFDPSQDVTGPAPVAVGLASVFLGIPGQILQLPKTATPSTKPTTIVSSVAGPDDLHLDPAGASVYWSDWGSGSGTDGTVGKFPVGGGTPTVMHQGLVTPEAVAVNSTYVFWLSNGTLTAGGQGATAVGTGIVYRSGK